LKLTHDKLLSSFAFNFHLCPYIERLLEYVAIGPRFSNVVLQALLILLKRQGLTLVTVSAQPEPSLIQKHT